MTDLSKDMNVEFRLFALYGLRDVVAAAGREQVRAADFVPLA